MPLRLSLRRLPAALCMAGILVLPARDLAQGKRPDEPGGSSALDSILLRLDGNLDDYRRSVPSFFCSEHSVSRVEPGPGLMSYMTATTESIFRVLRGVDGDRQSKINESRVVKTVNGRPPDDSAKIDNPMMVFGIFSQGLQVVSGKSKGCFQFKMHPARKDHPSDNIVINFEDLPAAERDADCPFDKHTSGRAIIKPATMRVVHLEARTRDYEILPGMRGTWEWSIDYAPVSLSGKIFWMPETIRSQSVADTVDQVTSSGATGRRGGATISSGSKAPVTYSLVAKYSDYHLLNVVSRIIIPGTDAGKDAGGGQDGKAGGADLEGSPADERKAEPVPAPEP